MTNRMNNRGSNTGGYMNRLVLLPFMFLTVVLLFTGGMKAEAVNQLPMGDIQNAPEIEFLGGTEVEDTGRNNVSDGVLLALNAGATGEHYKYLSSDEKILYNALYSAVSSKKYIAYGTDVNTMTDNQILTYAEYYFTGSYSFYQSKGNTEFWNMYNRAKQACVYDHPDMVELYLCWPVAGYGYTTGQSGTTYKDYLVFIAKYDNSKFNTLDSQIKTALNQHVTAIRSGGLVDSNWDAVTELKVHDYYMPKVTYDSACADASGDAGYFNLSHTAWGSLYNGNAVCDGYSLGFEMIMNSLGVDTLVISGVARDSGGDGGHAWNIVKLDGKWYEVDTTWDDQSTVIYDFFNRTTTDFASGKLRNGKTSTKHIRKTSGGYSGYLMPVANGTHYTYDYITGTSTLAKDDYVEVTGISTANSSVELKVGETYTIDVVFSPSNATNKNHSIIIANGTIISISDHVITALSAGSTKITIRSEENRFEAYIYVTVKADTQDEANSQTQEQITEDQDNDDSSEKTVDDAKETGSEIIVKKGSSAGTYTVSSSEDNEVQFTKAANKNVTKCQIPATITDENGVSYTVTEIAPSAFKKCLKLKTLTVPATIKKIGKNAFNGCKNLKTIKVYGNNLNTVKGGAFSGISQKATITVYARDKKTYNSVVSKLKKAGAKKQKYKFKKKA